MATFKTFYKGLDKFYFDLLRMTERLGCLEVGGQCTWMLRLWSVKSPKDQRSTCPSLRSLVVVKESGGSISGLLAELAVTRKSHGVPLVEAVEVVSDV